MEYRLITTFLSSLLALLIICGSAQASQTVTIPITIDHTLLETLIISRAFPDPGNSTTLINHGDGCILLTLSSPQISENSGDIVLDTDIFVRVGTPFGDSCFSPVEWRGYLQFQQQPYLISDSWEIGFKTIDSQLTGVDRKPPKIANLLLDLIEAHALTHFETTTLDLAPPVDDLKQFLLPLFPEEARNNTQIMLNSMRPGTLTVSDQSIFFKIFADVEDVYRPDDQTTEPQLQAEERANLISLWENWDALLSYLVVTISRKTLSESEQLILIDTLLETRYRFVQDLNDDTLSHDIVREQFVAAWQQLSPIFKSHLYQDLSTTDPLGYLAFVSASDALVVFDNLGPTFGLEISKDGLIRLMKMLDADPALLFYRSEINPELQKLFQLKPEEQEQQKLPPPQPPEKQDVSLLPAIFYRLSHLFAAQSALAADQPTFQEILKWKVPATALPDYIGRVKTLLEKSADSVIKDKNIPDYVRPMFRYLIPAMAWQESCFRQFVVKNRKLDYLLSYNGSSVGLMQINERVWRGIYNRSLLRWDIAYNARAGCEIAAMYLKKYGLAKGDNLGEDTLARTVYAIYNGGPSQYKKFLKRLDSDQLFLSDTLFWEKYLWVADGETDKVSICLSGS